MLQAGPVRSACHWVALVAVAAALTMPAMAQQDTLGVPGPIEFEGSEFALAWTSNPGPTYFKQEYVPAGQAVESYNEMFIVEVLTEGATPLSAAQGMAMALEQRKGADPVVNYDTIENAATGEIILDFLLSDDTSGRLIVEWNAYRYVPLGDGLALYAISRRGYDDDAAAFLGGLKDWRQGSINALAGMDLPAITIGN